MDSYQWEFGDGQTGSSKDPSHLYSAPGTYAVKLNAAKGGCSKNCTGTVEVKQKPDCSWISSSPVCNGTAVQFSGPSGMDSYQWEFGDGQVGSGKDPAHLYTAPGTYTVNLTVSKGGCSKSCTGTVVVKPIPDCSWISNAPVCSGTPVQFSGPAEMDSYQWDFGDGAVSSSKDPSHLYSAPGTYSVNLKATKGGCTKSCAESVEVKPQPDCSWTSNSPVYYPNPIQFTGPSGMESYQWIFGDGSSSAVQSPSHAYAAAGSYDVSLTVSKGGCSRACAGRVQVKSQPGDCWTSNSPVCIGTAVVFDAPSGMDSYKWNFGDGSESQEEDPVHLYSAPGTYDVVLTMKVGHSYKACPGSVVVGSQTDCGRISNAPVPNGTAAQLNGSLGVDSSGGEVGGGQVSSREDRVRIYPG
jgi:PKD repeat protein